jgi:phosphoribosylglycinamide formyltransferase-1
MGASQAGNQLRIAVLGSGKGSNCQSIMDAIAAGDLNARIVCVLSDVEDAYILQRAGSAGIPARYISAAPYRTKLEGAAEQAYIDAIRECRADVIALAGFMRILKPALLSAFEGRILNIHPSLLPAFPGLAAWEQALNYGVKVTGCTVHLVDEGTDTGVILVQRTVPVRDADTPESLHARIQEQEHIAYPAALAMFAGGALRMKGRRACVCAS